MIAEDVRPAVPPRAETSPMHRMPFGAEVQDDGTVRFRFWAPAEPSVRLVVDGVEEALPLKADGNGWHALTTGRAAAGSRYRFALGDGFQVPDPASRYQPEDCHGPSEVIDPRAFAWSDGGWRGRPWHEAVLYELHVGTFTPEGTFRGAIDRLDHLARLGVTVIEVMPVADFPGTRNWGYDGVLLYAPDAAYGRPEDFKAFVDAAHARGLMVMLDVVYNHFGPDGNYFGRYAPPLFTERHHTPWGAAINYDGEESRPVRDFMIHNALYWLEEFHLDGLRLDAVHAIIDAGEEHLLVELSRRARSAFPDRHVHLIIENEENEATLLERDAAGEPALFTAQWNDDVHHGLHTAVTDEASGYYADYHGDTEKLGRALAEGFAFQGEEMTYRGSARGEPSGHLPPTAFVAFLQNHDQIGNRALGDRITGNAPPEAVRAAAAVTLLAPQIPMLFMGEEWASAEPFVFFCNFNLELSELVRKGRHEEFSRFPEFQDPAARELIPDPTAEATFRSAQLDWSALDRPDHAERLGWYRRVLTVRHREIVPRLAAAPGGAGRYAVFGPGCICVEWRLGDGSLLRLDARLSQSVEGAGSEGRAAVGPGRVLWREGPAGNGDDGTLGPWSAVWTIQEPDATGGDPAYSLPAYSLPARSPSDDTTRTGSSA